MLLDHQISILERFLKYHVTLKIEMMLKIHLKTLLFLLYF